MSLEGYLQKRNRHGRWQSRFCSCAEGRFSYWSQEGGRHESDPSFTVDLVTEVEKVEYRGGVKFFVLHFNASGGGKQLMMRASSVAEAKVWGMEMQRVIDAGAKNLMRLYSGSEEEEAAVTQANFVEISQNLSTKRFKQISSMEQDQRDRMINQEVNEHFSGRGDSCIAACDGACVALEELQALAEDFAVEVALLSGTSKACADMKQSCKSHLICYCEVVYNRLELELGMYLRQDVNLDEALQWEQVAPLLVALAAVEEARITLMSIVPDVAGSLRPLGFHDADSLVSCMIRLAGAKIEVQWEKARAQLVSWKEDGDDGGPSDPFPVMNIIGAGARCLNDGSDEAILQARNFTTSCMLVLVSLLQSFSIPPQTSGDEHTSTPSRSMTDRLLTFSGRCMASLLDMGRLNKDLGGSDIFDASLYLEVSTAWQTCASDCIRLMVRDFFFMPAGENGQLGACRGELFHSAKWLSGDTIDEVGAALASWREDVESRLHPQLAGVYVNSLVQSAVIWYLNALFDEAKRSAGRSRFGSGRLKFDSPEETPEMRRSSSLSMRHVKQAEEDDDDDDDQGDDSDAEVTGGGNEGRGTPEDDEQTAETEVTPHSAGRALFKLRGLKRQVSEKLNRRKKNETAGAVQAAPSAELSKSSLGGAISLRPGLMKQRSSFNLSSSSPSKLQMGNDRPGLIREGSLSSRLQRSRVLSSLECARVVTDCIILRKHLIAAQGTVPMLPSSISLLRWTSRFIKGEPQDIASAFATFAAGLGSSPRSCHLVSLCLYDLLRIILRLRGDLGKIQSQEVLSLAAGYVEQLQVREVEHAQWDESASLALRALFPNAGVEHRTGKKWALECGSSPEAVEGLFAGLEERTAAELQEQIGETTRGAQRQNMPQSATGGKVITAADDHSTWVRKDVEEAHVKGSAACFSSLSPPSKDPRGDGGMEQLNGIDDVNQSLQDALDGTECPPAEDCISPKVYAVENADVVSLEVEEHVSQVNEPVEASSTPFSTGTNKSNSAAITSGEQSDSGRCAFGVGGLGLPTDDKDATTASQPSGPHSALGGVNIEQEEVAESVVVAAYDPEPAELLNGMPLNDAPPEAGVKIVTSSMERPRSGRRVFGGGLWVPTTDEDVHSASGPEDVAAMNREQGKLLGMTGDYDADQSEVEPAILSTKVPPVREMTPVLQPPLKTMIATTASSNPVSATIPVRSQSGKRAFAGGAWVAPPPEEPASTVLQHSVHEMVSEASSTTTTTLNSSSSSKAPPLGIPQPAAREGGATSPSTKTASVTTQKRRFAGGGWA